METTRKPYTVKCEGISRRYYYAHVTGDAPTIAANTALLEVQARARREGQEPDELAVVAIREGTLPEDEMRSAGVMSAEAALCRLALVTQKLIHAIDKPLACPRFDRAEGHGGVGGDRGGDFAGAALPPEQ